MEDILFQESSPVTELNGKLQEIRSEIAKVIVGQQQVVDLLLIGILCDGHLLLEGVPGVAKTLASKLIARIIDVNFSRLQFTAVNLQFTPRQYAPSANSLRPAPRR